MTTVNTLFGTFDEKQLMFKKAASYAQKKIRTLNK